MTFPFLKKMLMCFVLAALSLAGEAQTFHDKPDMDLKALFVKERATYVIRYNHVFSGTLVLPYLCKLQFEGGALSGPIVFNENILSGKVNLKGSSIRGRIRNKKVDASWLCAIDGITDDAKSINELIDVCGNVYFPKGNYKLISAFNSKSYIGEALSSKISAHIGIYRNNVRLQGEKGATFVTDEPMTSICVFSRPNQIERSVSNIVIKGISFVVHNDGKNFHEFMSTISLRGVNKIIIENCMFEDFWGDGICLSHYGDTPQTGERTRNQNVKILNNTIIGGGHHNNRNGISVISGKNVLIKENVIRNTSRKDMPGGIDIEPNNSAYTIENIRVVDNVLEGIKGSGGAICLVVFNEGPAHWVLIEGNVISDSNTGLCLYVKSDYTCDNIIIKNNHIAEDTKPYSFIGEGKSKNWTIKGNIFDRPCKQDIPGLLQVDNLIVKNNKKKD